MKERFENTVTLIAGSHRQTVSWSNAMTQVWHRTIWRRVAQLTEDEIVRAMKVVFGLDEREETK